jgi:hypothetical protein
MTPAAFRKLALSFDESHEEPHFERASFRVGKKIFATLVRDGSEAMVKIHPLERVHGLLGAYPEVFFDYGGWTWKGGAIGVRLKKADAKLIRELMTDAWRQIAPKRVTAPKKSAGR